VLPSAGLVDGLATPHAGGSVEVEEDTGAGAAAVLEDEVAVEEDGFDLGEEAVVAVEVGPAGLHHADAWLGEMVDDLAHPVGRGNEVGVKDRDELALRGFEALFEGSGCETTMARATPTVSSVESSRSWISKRSRG
jgi:hypothetical protein